MCVCVCVYPPVVGLHRFQPVFERWGNFNYLMRVAAEWPQPLFYGQRWRWGRYREVGWPRGRFTVRDLLGPVGSDHGWEMLPGKNPGKNPERIPKESRVNFHVGPMKNSRRHRRRRRRGKSLGVRGGENGRQWSVGWLGGKWGGGGGRQANRDETRDWTTSPTSLATR